LRKECLMEEKKHQKAPNVDQLRAAIDSGATGDKVAFPDPAAAPLGTDAEAAGASPPALNAIRPSRRGRSRGRRGPSRKGGALSMMLGFLGLIAAAAVITFLIFAA
jgi:hypothetical protein